MGLNGKVVGSVSSGSGIGHGPGLYETRDCMPWPGQQFARLAYPRPVSAPECHERENVQLVGTLAEPGIFLPEKGGSSGYPGDRLGAFVCPPGRQIHLVRTLR